MEGTEKKELYQKIEHIDIRINRILNILESDHKTHSKGLVEQVELTRAELEALLIREKVITGKVAVYIAIGGVIVSFLAFVLPILIKKY
jgi:hypothetical protein